MEKSWKINVEKEGHPVCLRSCDASVLLQSSAFDIVSLSRSSGVFYAKLCLGVRVLYFSIMSYLL